MLQSQGSIRSPLVRESREGIAGALGRDDEAELARLLKARSARAWDALFERHFDQIYRYGLGRLLTRQSAEDLAATTFARALSAIDAYSYRGRPVLAWLYGIAGNVAKEILRGEARERHAQLSHGVLNPNRDESDTRLGMWQGDTVPTLAGRIDLYNAMLRLTRIQREVVLLRYFAGLSASETGQVIGRPETAVYSLQARALAALRRQLI